MNRFSGRARNLFRVGLGECEVFLLARGIDEDVHRDNDSVRARGCDYFVFHFDIQVDSRVEVCLCFMNERRNKDFFIMKEPQIVY